MRVAVISDTHLARPSAALERIFEMHLARADVLLHLGDVTGLPTLELFQFGHPRFHAVAGNCDSAAVAGELPAMRELELEGFRVGMAHGWGERARIPETLSRAFGPGFDILLFGHSHSFLWDPSGPVRFLNPGTLCAPRNDPPGFAWLVLEAGREPEVEHVIL